MLGDTIERNEAKGISTALLEDTTLDGGEVEFICDAVAEREDFRPSTPRHSLGPALPVWLVVPVPKRQNFVFPIVEKLCHVAIFHVSITENLVPAAAVSLQHRLVVRG